MVQALARTRLKDMHRFARMVGEIGDRGKHFVIIAIALQRQVVPRQARLHFAHFFRLDAQAVSNVSDLPRAECLAVRLHATQVEKQLALRLGRGQLDHPPVLQDVLVNLRLDPVDGERHQPDTVRRIEALDRFHQADIALLDQVGVRQTVPQIAARDRDYQPKMRKHQLSCRIEIAVVTKTGGQTKLLLLRQHGKLSGRLDIGINAADRRNGR